MRNSLRASVTVLTVLLLAGLASAGMGGAYERILFIARDVYHQAEIFAIAPTAPTDSTPEQLTNVTGEGVVDLAVSPDGTKIGYIASKDYGKSQLFVMAADGTQPQQIFPAAATDTADIAHPCFSRDSRMIVFALRENGRYHLCAVAVNGNGGILRQVSHPTDNYMVPSLLGDGSILCSVWGRGNAPHIDKIDAQGKVNTVIAWGEHPAASPDGTQIVFERLDHSDDLYLAAAAGQQITRLTNTGNTCYAPAWSPDGAQLAFAGFTVDAPQWKHLICIIKPDGTEYRELQTHLNSRPIAVAWAALAVAPRPVPPTPPWNPDWIKIITPPQPDLAIAENQHAYLGDGIFEMTGDEAMSQEVPWGQIAVYQLKVSNAGGVAESFNVQATLGTRSAQWTVKLYTDDGRDITRQIAGPGILTPLLAPGAAVNYRLEVTAASSVANGTAVDVLVKVVSPLDNTVGDAVKATTTKIAR